MSDAPTREELRDLKASAARKARRLKSMTLGAQLQYSPPKETTAHHGETVTVLRAPRSDVKSPTARIQFAGGTKISVPVHHLRPLPPGALYRPSQPTPEDPPSVQDARSRPAWERLLNVIDELVEAEQTGQPREPLDANVRHRLAQLAGMVSPRGTPADEKGALAAQLRVYAELDAQRRHAVRPGRAGYPLQPAQRLPKPTDRLDSPEWLDQEQRRMINTVARCIHLRYFISDRAERHALRVPSHVRAALRAAGRSEDRAVEQPSPSQPRASELHLVAADSYRFMVADALEVCQYLAVGKTREAQVLLQQQQAARVRYALTTRQIEALRPLSHTGRFFHGDILSVRDERPEDADAGNPDASGMSQYYTRLTIVYAQDGYSLTVANAPELEAQTATVAGEDAWKDLCRWITDTSQRRDGKKQGRRQDDDGELVYRENEGSLRLRDNISEQYPRLVAALEVVRRSLEAQGSDVLGSEIPENHPARGFHPAVENNEKKGGT
ncbi:hypothetical protein [Deinococcus frigens]|uniref:hypothetical protein n=1 Tax=Deinococcus frigens TaxID=249403 RepID=UPI0004959C78|nr:hypothetical protein [Deinococcus frigens]